MSGPPPKNPYANIEVKRTYLHFGSKRNTQESANNNNATQTTNTNSAASTPPIALTGAAVVASQQPTPSALATVSGSSPTPNTGVADGSYGHGGAATRSALVDARRSVSFQSVSSMPPTHRPADHHQNDDYNTLRTHQHHPPQQSPQIAGFMTANTYTGSFNHPPSLHSSSSATATMQACSSFAPPPPMPQSETCPYAYPDDDDSTAHHFQLYDYQNQNVAGGGDSTPSVVRSSATTPSRVSSTTTAAYNRLHHQAHPAADGNADDRLASCQADHHLRRGDSCATAASSRSVGEVLVFSQSSPAEQHCGVGGGGFGVGSGGDNKDGSESAKEQSLSQQLLSLSQQQQQQQHNNQAMHGQGNNQRPNMNPSNTVTGQQQRFPPHLSAPAPFPSATTTSHHVGAASNAPPTALRSHNTPTTTSATASVSIAASSTSPAKTSNKTFLVFGSGRNNAAAQGNTNTATTTTTTMTAVNSFSAHTGVNSGTSPRATVLLPPQHHAHQTSASSAYASTSNDPSPRPSLSAFPTAQQSPHGIGSNAKTTVTTPPPPAVNMMINTAQQQPQHHHQEQPQRSFQQQEGNQRRVTVGPNAFGTASQTAATSPSPSTTKFAHVVGDAPPISSSSSQPPVKRTFLTFGDKKKKDPVNTMNNGITTGGGGAEASSPPKMPTPSAASSFAAQNNSINRTPAAPQPVPNAFPLSVGNTPPIHHPNQTTTEALLSSTQQQSALKKEAEEKERKVNEVKDEDRRKNKKAEEKKGRRWQEAENGRGFTRKPSQPPNWFNLFYNVPDKNPYDGDGDGGNSGGGLDLNDNDHANEDHFADDEGRPTASNPFSPSDYTYSYANLSCPKSDGDDDGTDARPHAVSMNSQLNPPPPPPQKHRFAVDTSDPGNMFNIPFPYAKPYEPQRQAMNIIRANVEMGHRFRKGGEVAALAKQIASQRRQRRIALEEQRKAIAVAEKTRAKHERKEKRKAAWYAAKRLNNMNARKFGATASDELPLSTPSFTSSSSSSSAEEVAGTKLANAGSGSKSKHAHAIAKDASNANDNVDGIASSSTDSLAEIEDADIHEAVDRLKGPDSLCGVTVIEAPTGTGKTHVLLNSILSWLSLQRFKGAVARRQLLMAERREILKVFNGMNGGGGKGGGRRWGGDANTAGNTDGDDHDNATDAMDPSPPTQPSNIALFRPDPPIGDEADEIGNMDWRTATRRNNNASSSLYNARRSSAGLPRRRRVAAGVDAAAAEDRRQTRIFQEREAARAGVDLGLAPIETFVSPEIEAAAAKKRAAAALGSTFYESSSSSEDERRRGRGNAKNNNRSAQQKGFSYFKNKNSSSDDSDGNNMDGGDDDDVCVPFTATEQYNMLFGMTEDDCLTKLGCAETFSQIPLVKPKLWFSSRTHSQLQQCADELSAKTCFSRAEQDLLKRAQMAGLVSANTGDTVGCYGFSPYYIPPETAEKFIDFLRSPEDPLFRPISDLDLPTNRVVWEARLKGKAGKGKTTKEDTKDTVRRNTTERRTAEEEEDDASLPLTQPASAGNRFDGGYLFADTVASEVASVLASRSMPFRSSESDTARGNKRQVEEEHDDDGAGDVESRHHVDPSLLLPPSEGSQYYEGLEKAMGLEKSNSKNKAPNNDGPKRPIDISECFNIAENGDQRYLDAPIQSFTPIMPLSFVHLGSRAQLCINAELCARARSGGTDQTNDMCKEATANERDSYAQAQKLLRSGEHSCSPNPATGIIDIEDVINEVKTKKNQTRLCDSCPYSRYDRLKKLRDFMRKRGSMGMEDVREAGIQLGACPYFASRQMVRAADIVFLHFNNLVNPIMRQGLLRFEPTTEESAAEVTAFMKDQRLKEEKQQNKDESMREKLIANASKGWQKAAQQHQNALQKKSSSPAAWESLLSSKNISTVFSNLVARSCLTPLNMVGDIVVFDEGHNVVEVARSTLRADISYVELRRAKNAIAFYYEKFGRFLKPESADTFRKLITTAKKLQEYLRKSQRAFTTKHRSLAITQQQQQRQYYRNGAPVHNTNNNDASATLLLYSPQTLRELNNPIQPPMSTYTDIKARRLYGRASSDYSAHHVKDKQQLIRAETLSSFTFTANIANVNLSDQISKHCDPDKKRKIKGAVKGAMKQLCSLSMEFPDRVTFDGFGSPFFCDNRKFAVFSAAGARALARAGSTWAGFGVANPAAVDPNLGHDDSSATSQRPNLMMRTGGGGHNASGVLLPSQIRRGQQQHGNSTLMTAATTSTPRSGANSTISANRGTVLLPQWKFYQKYATERALRMAKVGVYGALATQHLTASSNSDNVRSNMSPQSTRAAAEAMEGALSAIRDRDSNDYDDGSESIDKRYVQRQRAGEDDYHPRERHGDDGGDDEDGGGDAMERGRSRYHSMGPRGVTGFNNNDNNVGLLSGIGQGCGGGGGGGVENMSRKQRVDFGRETYEDFKTRNNFLEEAYEEAGYSDCDETFTDESDRRMFPPEYYFNMPSDCSPPLTVRTNEAYPELFLLDAVLNNAMRHQQGNSSSAIIAEAARNALKSAHEMHTAKEEKARRTRVACFKFDADGCGMMDPRVNSLNTYIGGGYFSAAGRRGRGVNTTDNNDDNDDGDYDDGFFFRGDADDPGDDGAAASLSLTIGNGGALVSSSSLTLRQQQQNPVRWGMTMAEVDSWVARESYLTAKALDSFFELFDKLDMMTDSTQMLVRRDEEGALKPGQKKRGYGSPFSQNSNNNSSNNAGGSGGGDLPIEMKAKVMPPHAMAMTVFPLDASTVLQKLQRECRHMIFAGGTLTPLSITINPILPLGVYQFEAFGHIVDVQKALRVITMAITPSPSRFYGSHSFITNNNGSNQYGSNNNYNGNNNNATNFVANQPADAFHFTFQNKPRSQQMMLQACELMLQLAAIVPEGLVAFFTSYEFMNTFIRMLNTAKVPADFEFLRPSVVTTGWQANNASLAPPKRPYFPPNTTFFEAISKFKKIFHERKDQTVDQLLTEYSEYIENNVEITATPSPTSQQQQTEQNGMFAAAVGEPNPSRGLRVEGGLSAVSAGGQQQQQRFQNNQQSAAAASNVLTLNSYVLDDEERLLDRRELRARIAEEDKHLFGDCNNDNDASASPSSPTRRKTVPNTNFVHPPTPVPMRLSHNPATRHHRGAMITGVLGGKISEGINFNDQLGRAVVVFGQPRHNPFDAEVDMVLTETASRLKYGGRESVLFYNNDNTDNNDAENGSAADATPPPISSSSSAPNPHAMGRRRNSTAAATQTTATATTNGNRSQTATANASASPLGVKLISSYDPITFEAAKISIEKLKNDRVTARQISNQNVVPRSFLSHIQNNFLSARAFTDVIRREEEDEDGSGAVDNVPNPNKSIADHKEGLTNSNTMKAVNQAIGRVIRHQHDHAVVILCDQRYGDRKIVQRIPKWMRPVVNNFAAEGRDINEAAVILEQFFEQKERESAAAQPNK